MNNVISKSRPAQDMATAISSSLSKRSSPTIPLASAVYEPLVKSVLARRFVYNVLSESAAVAWLLAAIWTYWQQGGVGSLGVFGGIVSWLSPLTLFFAILWLSLASVPIAVLRKMYLQGELVLLKFTGRCLTCVIWLLATYSPLPSPRQTLFRNAAERPYQYALVVTLASSACLTVCQALMAQSVEKYSRGDPKLGIWAGSRKHSYHLNGNLCFLFLSQLTCASFYWLRDILKNRFSIRWSSQENVFVQAFPLLSSSLFSMVILSATSTACSLVIFAILRSIMLPVLYRLPVIHSLLRPFVAHFLSIMLPVLYRLPVIHSLLRYKTGLQIASVLLPLGQVPSRVVILIVLSTLLVDNKLIVVLIIPSTLLVDNKLIVCISLLSYPASTTSAFQLATLPFLPGQFLGIFFPPGKLSALNQGLSPFFLSFKSLFATFMFLTFLFSLLVIIHIKVLLILAAWLFYVVTSHPYYHRHVCYPLPQLSL
ncbi:hypothetical protein A7U60_g3346 [Sanghuangporus baumii]|uniref:Uncharacterized protein n=1 Tax=Sanghuangporus baumii TaxID=108892 RepID=A0A9Q5I0I9_SANBA|nr:hypothetical protein A7U60_g3346 [Sanghuangporus baumii]